VHTTFEGSWIHQIVKVYKGKQYIDIEYTVGPIPIDDGVGKEVVNLFRTGISNNGTFFTDSNGREFMKRERSQRQTWDMEEFEPVAGNYYPVNAAIFIEDDHSSLAVLTDRTQGGSSLQDGSIELMVHRRIIKDDSRGVDEALNETTGIMPYPPFGDASRLGEGLIVTGTHRIMIGDKKSGAHMARTEMDQMFSPTYTFAVKSSAEELFARAANKNLSALVHQLPENVQLLTVKLISSDENGKKSILLRLGHAYGKGECNANSDTATVDISALFSGFRLIEFSEKTLTGNQDKADWNQNKMHWFEKKDIVANANPIITMNPMEVKTFEIILEPK